MLPSLPRNRGGFRTETGLGSCRLCRRLPCERWGYSAQAAKACRAPDDFPFRVRPLKSPPPRLRLGPVRSIAFLLQVGSAGSSDCYQARRAAPSSVARCWNTSPTCSPPTPATTQCPCSPESAGAERLPVSHIPGGRARLSRQRLPRSRLTRSAPPAPVETSHLAASSAASPDTDRPRR
jgi:hypothetical protein